MFWSSLLKKSANEPATKIMPARRQRTLEFKLQPLKTIGDVAAASEASVSGVARGQLTPAEGQAFSGMLEDRRRVIETRDQEPRIRAQMGC